jgi:HlyD family secretion protein
MLAAKPYAGARAPARDRRNNMTPFPKLAHSSWRYGVGAVAAAALAIFLWTWWQGPQVAVEAVLRRDLLQTVVASGHVESPHRVDIGAQITATVVRVPVAEGQSVKAGALLIALGSKELQAAERQAIIGLAQAHAKLRQLQEVQAPVAEQALRQAHSSLDNARASYQRNQNLFQQGFIGQAALDDSRKSVELADAQTRAAQKQFDSTASAGSDYALAQGAVDEARATVAVAQARTQYTQIQAPQDGVLIARHVEVGDVVQAGKVLMTLSPVGKTQMVVAIDEKNLHLIALGQQALVSADAYPHIKFKATLVYINPGVNVQTGAVEVKLDVDQPPEVLRQDMTVSVDIEVARRPQALLVSAAAVRDADGGAPWVLRVAGGRAEKVAVTLGLRSGGQVEVLQGLQAADLLATGATTVQPGERVRVLSAKP